MPASAMVRAFSCLPAQDESLGSMAGDKHGAEETQEQKADAGEALHLGLGEVSRRDALEALLVELLLGHVVVHALGGGVREDELLVHGDEFDAVRAVVPNPLKDLDVPVPQVRSDCLVRPLVDALSHSCLPPRVGVCPLGAPCGADDACGKAAVQGVKAKRGCA